MEFNNQLLDKDGNVVLYRIVSYNEEKGYYIIENNHFNYGIIDKDKNFLVECLYGAGWAAEKALENPCKDSIYENKECIPAIDRCISFNKKDIKYGLVDSKENIIVPHEYNEIKHVKDTSNFIVLTTDLKRGLINKDGEFLLTPQYIRIDDHRFDGQLRIQSWDSFQLGLADKNTGYINLQPEYSDITKDRTGFYHLEKDFKYGIADNNFNIILQPEYDFISLYPGNKYYMLMQEIPYENEEGLTSYNKMYGIIDLKGNFVIPLGDSDIGNSPVTYKQSFKKNGKYYIFNSKTGEIFPDYTRRNLTQEQVSELTEIDDSDLNKIESGCCNPTDDNPEKTENAPNIEAYKHYMSHLHKETQYLIENIQEMLINASDDKIRLAHKILTCIFY